MSTAAFILVVSALANMILGGFVLLRNPKQVRSISFFLLSFCITAWAGANYLTEQAPTLSLNATFNKLAYLFAFLMSLSLAWFSYNFPTPRPYTRKKILLFGLVLAAGSLFSISKYVSGRVTVVQGQLSFSPGKLSIIYALLLFLVLGFAIKNFVYSIKHGTAIEKSQSKLMIAAFSISATLAIFSNVIFPALSSNWDLAKFGPLFTILMVGSIGFAIIRHKLFDIRLVVARSLAYVLSLGAIILIYSIFIFGIFTRFGGTETSVAFQQSFYLMTAILLGFSFSPIKRFFDKVTNKLFYRDAYNTQQLLNDFNAAIVSTIELEKLLGKSAEVIDKYLKPAFTSFSLVERDSNIRLMRANHTKLTPKVIDQARGYMKSSKQKVYLTDNLEENTDLKSLLKQEEIAALIRVTKNVNTEGLGYIILGYKLSGAIYNSQDESAIETVANELAIAIENALQYEEIQSFAKTLQAKVDDATRQLRKTNEKLKQLDQTKDDFISMASHQLRTPLTSVKGYVSMVLEGDVGKVTKDQRKLLDQAFISSQRMVYLIADLLNVSRLRTGKFIIEPKPTNLADVVEGEMAQLTETAKGRGLELTYTKPKNFPTLMLDETKIRQVVMNFADNAVYYTPSGGHISVNLVDKPESIEFTVVDDGIGVPKAEQHHLFNKFYRAGNAKKARPDGTGLGLFMAKKVVVAQGGSIIFNSQEGKGSTFGFNFAKKPLLPTRLTPPATPGK